MTIELSKETEQYLEAYRVEHGLKKDDMFEIVEEAIETFLFKQMMRTAQKRNAQLDTEETEAMIEQTIKEDRKKQRQQQNP